MNYFKQIKISIICIFLPLFWVLLFSCEDQKKRSREKITEQTKNLAPAPLFNSDSAYSYIKKQVEFGPRVPNTDAHIKGGDYLISFLKSQGILVHTQEFEATAFNGKSLKLRNIVGIINPEAPKRILLASHWDSRPFADKDTENKDMPIDGANDGASGVGILMEIGRVINESKNKPNVGVDIMFFDGEDYGQPHGNSNQYPADSWCLGSQYWARNKHLPNYNAYYGILLDMVGAKGAKFALEGTSMQFAPTVMRNIWEIGHGLGFGQYFVYEETPGITDDHAYVNQIAKIPMIDIIEYNGNNGEYFGWYHHTHKDNINIIDKNTLKAVGQTVLTSIYQE